MKRLPPLFYGALGILVLVIGVTSFLLLNSKEEDNEPLPGVQFPTGDPGMGAGAGTPTREVSLQNGDMIATLDFVDNGVTIEDPANAGVYYLAGSSGACTPDGACPVAGESGDYSIVYYTTDDSFAIGIMDEPIGKIRIEAEQALQKALGISSENMCSLKYTIGTTAYVNETYGGENLGFSYCPGAVALPS